MMAKVFFDMPVKRKEEAYIKNIEISKNNDYTAGNLLDYEYFSKRYKLIAVDLSKKLNQKTLVKGNKLILLANLKMIE